MERPEALVRKGRAHRPRVTVKPSLLRTLKIFASLPDARLDAIEQQCIWHGFGAGEIILNHLEVNDNVYFLVDGKARVGLYSFGGKSVTFCDLASGEMFGEYAAIDGGSRSASIEAITDCFVGSMTGASFRKLLRDEPELALTLLGQCVGKIRALSRRIYEFSTLAVSNRIQAEVLRLGRLVEADDGTAVINPAPTHADIASRTSTHREAVTRELNRLARDGIIERRGRQLRVKDMERLADLVHAATGE